MSPNVSNNLKMKCSEMSSIVQQLKKVSNAVEARKLLKRGRTIVCSARAVLRKSLGIA